MIRLWKFLHERKALETDAEKMLRKKYEQFLTILAENEHSLDLMTQLENKLYDKQLISIPYLKVMIKNLSNSMRNVVYSVTNLSGGRYDRLLDIYQEIDRQIQRIITGGKEPIHTPVIITMDDISREFIDKVGGKMANAGELRKSCQIQIPDGFAATVCSLTHFFEFNNLSDKINEILAKIDVSHSRQLIKAEKEIKQVILEAQIPPEIEYFVRRESEKLEHKHSHPIHWAVRSSAIGEDMEHSFAGQFSTLLNVPSDQLLEKYKEVVASKYNARAIVYQRLKNIRDEDVNMSVGFMEMVDPLCSGVMYTTNPVRPDSRQIAISAVWGLGQLLVEGVVSADVYRISREPGFPLLRKEIAEKEICLIRLKNGGVKHAILPPQKSQQACLNAAQLKTLGEMALKVEAYFQSPQDIEWCFDRSGRLYVLQSRRLHVFDNVKRRNLSGTIEAPLIAENAQPVAAGAASGKVFKALDIHELVNFPQGGILVIKNSSPRFVGALQKASALVVERGNLTDHMSSVVREFNVPCVVRIPSIFSLLQNGQEITVDATEGRIYNGRVAELLIEKPKLQNHTIDVIHTESYRLLNQAAPLIFPLHLTDPRVDDFRADACRTWHDILRFSHETALNEMFLLKEKGHLNVVKNAYKIATDLPFKLLVLDLFGNTVNESPNRVIAPESVDSLPFKELWKGMTAPDVPWNGPGRQMRINDLFTAMSRTSMYEGNAEAAKSYAVVTPEYLNLSLSMGYHYVVMDCYLSDDPYNNYISLSFKGGAARAAKRHLRAVLVAKILKPMGFKVHLKNDFLKSRIKAESAEELAKKIKTIGRLLGVTRLLDFSLENEETVNVYVQKFYEHGDLPETP